MSSPYSGTTVGASHFFDLSCSDDYYDYGYAEAAPELVFSIDVPAGSQITFQPPASSYDSVYEVRSGGSCPGENNVACGTSYTTGSLSWMNTQSTMQTVYYIQSGYAGASGDFTLDWSFSGEPSTHSYDACAECGSGLTVGGVCRSNLPLRSCRPQRRELTLFGHHGRREPLLRSVVL